MKLLRVSGIGLLILCLAIVPVYAKSEQGQGKGQEQGNQGQGNQDRGKSGQDHGNQGQGNSSNTSAASRATDPEVRRHTIERDRNQADLRANRPIEQDKARKNLEHALAKGKGIAKFEHTKWSYNPKDTRGQGNMGKVDMRDPYGFDKDSGREKSERGRAIHPEPILDLATLLSLSVHIDDPWYLTLLQQVQYWLQQANNPSPYYSQNTIQYYLNYWQNRLANYVAPVYDKVWVGNTTLPKTIYYSLDVSDLPDTFIGTELLVNMTLTSINDYTENFSFVDWSRRTTTEPNYYGYAIVTKTYEYDAGELAAEYNQEITLNGDGTYDFSYSPPEELSVGPKGGYFELAVTVTEPISGATYTMTYDRQILILRCPYGRVYDAKTSKAIVGAKVTVFDENGSIVTLDKAANSTANNPQTTDATGRYGFKLETNKKYYIKATAPGYQDFKSAVFTEKWHVLREDIALTPMGMVK